MSHAVRLSKTVFESFLIWLCVILVVAGFGIYLAGPAYHSRTLITEESQDMTIDPLGSALSAISEPESLFQAQYGYSNLTNLVLSQELRFSVSVLNGTARISLVTLGLSGDLFKTIVPLQTVLVFDNATFSSTLLRLRQTHLVGLALLNPSLHSITVSINGSRTLLVAEPDFGIPLTCLEFALALLVCLHVYGIYRRKDPIFLVSEFLKRKLMPRSYVKGTTRNGGYAPVFLLLSLLFVFVIVVGGFIPFFSAYGKAPHIYKPLVNLGLDLVMRMLLSIYLAALSAYAILVFVFNSVNITYRARITARNDLGAVFAAYDASSRPGSGLLIAFGTFLWLMVLFFSGTGEYSQNGIWVLLLSCPIWAILLDQIVITALRRVSTEYLTIFKYELASLGIATLVLAAMPGVLGAIFSFEIWLTKLLVPSTYPIISVPNLSEIVLQASNFLRRNLLLLAVIPALMFWCSRFFAFFFMDIKDRKTYGKEAASDILVILGVFLFGQLLLSRIEPLSVETNVRALLLALASNQVRYVLGKLT